MEALVRVTINKAVCQGNGRCAAAAPNVYELDELGYNAGGEREIDEVLAEDAFRGASACPERAIQVYFE